jgi:hypothetical protein
VSFFLKQEALIGRKPADPELSSAQRELGDKILSALNIVKMPITSHEWKYQPSLALYQLIIQTP